MAKETSIIRLSADTNNYERNIRQAQKTFQDFTSGIGLNMKTLTGVGAAIGTVTTAVKVMKDAFMQSESSIDEWGRTMKGAESAYQTFLDTLNGGNWSDFFRNLELAVQGGRDLYDAFDRLGSVKSNNQLAIAMVQAQIQQLRALKQQGKDVDDQIKAASARLKSLQMEGVAAGKRAGATQIATTLTNRVNSIRDAQGLLTPREIGQAAGAYAVGGQKYMDEQAAIYARLKSKAQYQYQTQMFTPSGMSIPTTQTGYDLGRLTEEEKKQYVIARAITEGETELQQGLATLTSAVQDQASAWQQNFRNNRYSLTGGGGGGSRERFVDGGIRGLSLMGGAPGPTESMASLLAQQGAARKSLGNATNMYDAGNAQAELDDLQRRIDAQPLALRLGISTDAMVAIEDEMKALGENLPPLEIKTIGSVKGITKDAKAMSKEWKAAASAIASVGDAMSGIDDPAAKVMGTIAQAVASIALGYATATAQASEMGPWAWIAFAAAGLATMISTISAIHSATGYADGGIIPGNSFSGDNQWARVNAGELILNQAQTGIIASALQGGGSEGVAMQPYVEGEKVFLGMENWSKRSGRGDIVTTGMLRRMGLM